MSDFRSQLRGTEFRTLHRTHKPRYHGFGQLDKVLVGALALEAVHLWYCCAASKLLAFSNATSRVLVVFQCPTNEDIKLCGPRPPGRPALSPLSPWRYLTSASPWLLKWLATDRRQGVAPTYTIHSAVCCSLHQCGALSLSHRSRYASQVATYTLVGGIDAANACLGHISVSRHGRSTTLYVAAGAKASQFALSTLGQITPEVRLHKAPPRLRTLFAHYRRSLRRGRHCSTLRAHGAA